MDEPNLRRNTVMALLEHMKGNKKRYSLVAASVVAGITISWFSLRHNAYALSVNGSS